jgi:hypothetical protein
VTSHDRIVTALRMLARVMGHERTVTAERIAVTAQDLAPYDEGAIAAAIEQHRKTSKFFPQSSELLALVDPQRYSGTRQAVHPYAMRYACPHTPACRTINACRDRILDEAYAERQERSA